MSSLAAYGSGFFASAGGSWVSKSMEVWRSDSVTTLKRVNELNGTVGVCELPFQLTLDLDGCSKLAGNYSHTVKTGVVAQELSVSRCGYTLMVEVS